MGVVGDGSMALWGGVSICPRGIREILPLTILYSYTMPARRRHYGNRLLSTLRIGLSGICIGWVIGLGGDASSTGGLALLTTADVDGHNKEYTHHNDGAHYDYKDNTRIGEVTAPHW
jgi:hypothetical protein